MPLILGFFLALSFAGMIGALVLRRERPVYPPPLTLIIQPDVDLDLLRRDDLTYVLKGDSAMPVAIYGGASPEHIDRTRPVLVDLDEEGILIQDQSLARHRYFELLHDTGETRTIATRHLMLEGAVNFRDIGGYPTRDGRMVRWGRAYRAGTLAHLSESDWAYLHEIGVKLICDFRSPDEINKEPNIMPKESPIGYVNLPVNAEPDTRTRLRNLLFDPYAVVDLLPELYTDFIINRNAHVFGEVFRQLANPENYPLIYNCTAGKDRTGVMTALLLSLLDVPEEIIIADYTLSNRDYPVFYEYVAEMIQPVRWLGIRPDDLQPIITADARTIKYTLDYIADRHGSVLNYLITQAGVDKATVNAIRANLLE